MLGETLFFLCGGACGAVAMCLAVIAHLRRPSKMPKLPDDLSRFHTDPDN